MRTLALSTLICISAPNANEAFHYGQMSTPASGHRTRLDARRGESEIDKLRSKRLALRRDPIPEPAVEEVEEFDDLPIDAGLEYLSDGDERRDDDAPFHILLMPSTYQNTHLQIESVASSCVRVLNIPHEKAYELSMFAKYESFSVLGTWSRKECLVLGEKLREIGVECRVVPHDTKCDDAEDYLEPDPSLDFDSEWDSREFSPDLDWGEHGTDLLSLNLHI